MHSPWHMPNGHPDEQPGNVCPKCGEEFTLAWLSGDPPEPYGEVCGCPEAQEELSESAADKRAWDRDASDYPWNHSTDPEMNAALRADAAKLLAMGEDPGVCLEDLAASKALGPLGRTGGQDTPGMPSDG